jgi:glucose-1-phosphate adenylyltransferase
MDLVSVVPIFNLYNRSWPIYSLIPPIPPAKFVVGGEAHESIVAAGSIISGGLIDHSVLSFDVRVDKGASVIESVLLPGVEIGRNAIVRRAILDKNVVVEDGVMIGVDRERDEKLYTVSPGGVVVIGKNARAER